MIQVRQATTVSMTADRSVSASFSLNNHALTLSAGTGGTVSGGGNYGYGTSASITATPNTGYSFSGWSGTGVTDTEASYHCESPQIESEF